ncbi:hypothetical protein [Pseudomonas aeruginosa]|uniref:hypothetical protein n=1 Tax=Pseudomonas aeruginosa TaxID=287 RepID=UPI0023585566|nr:hypothetical protein [Pseudomonas aeruginosa]
MHSAAGLFEEHSSVDEPTGIEANRASELGKSLMQTVVAFSNEPGLDGGYLLLGTNCFVNDKGYTATQGLVGDMYEQKMLLREGGSQRYFVRG